MVTVTVRGNDPKHKGLGFWAFRIQGFGDLGVWLFEGFRVLGFGDLGVWRFEGFGGLAFAG